MRKLTKILSAILVFVLCVQIIAPGTVAIGATPLIGNNAAMSAEKGITLDSIGETTPLLNQAQDVNNSSMPIETSGKVTSVIGEVKELRTENTKHYRHEDGTYTAAVYPEPVHYMDSTGMWKDIDNTLSLNSKKKSVSGKATYTPAASSLDIRIPQDFADNQMLTIGKDGYTVGMRIKDSGNSATVSRSSSATESKISSAKAEIDNDFESIEIVNELSTSNISISNDFAVESANKEKMKLEKKVSAVNYNDIFDGADLQYVITPSKIKENIIVTEKQDSYVYQFELDLDGLIAVPQDNGSIKLYENLEDDEAMFTIETPYMFDANEETSFDVTMSLNGNILTVTASSEWINDESRVFPITIDPTFSTGSSTFYDATVGYGTPLLNYESYKYLYAGNGILSLRRTYIKFDLPTIPDGSVVTKSELKLLQYDIDVGNEDLYLYAVDLTGQSTWSEGSITWNNQPLSKSKNGPQDDYTIKKIDYRSFIKADGNQEYVFNLTKAVKNWYEGSTNNGIMISSSNETKNSQTTLYSSDHSTSSYHPSVTIEYTNNIGLEDYWTYETRDLGRSGTVYANPYNGSITYLHNDLNMTGNLLPINISHVYNSNTDGIYSTYYEGMYVGAKYHLSIQELLIPISTSDSMYSAGYRYKYYDSDGTLHYFKQTKISSNVYKYLLEYDPTVYVSYTNSYRMINYADGSKKYFYNDGRLYKIVDNNGNTQTFTYDGKKITQITDPVGRVAVLTYNTNGQLESITDPSGRKVSYLYGDTTATARLTSITYPDGKQTVITYTTNDYLYKLTAIDNSFLRFYYRTVSKRGRRVNWIDPYDKNGSRIDEIKFTYTATNESGTASGNSVVSNNYGESKTYLFDEYGRSISVTNQYGQSQYAVYGDDVTSNSDEFNKIMSSSDILTISGNLLKNHDFERNEYWTTLQTAATGNCNYSIEESSYGYRSLKMELLEDNGIHEVGQDFDAVAGETYTVSLDMYIPKTNNISNTSGASFGFVYCLNGVWYTESSGLLTSTNGWERFSHTVTIPEGTLTTCRVFIELTGANIEAYFDSIQVEKSAGARYYNLVENSDFSNTPDVTEGTDAVAATAYAWTKAGTQGDDGVYSVNGRNYVFMSGSPDHNKRIAQTIPVNAKAGDTLIIGGRAGAYATDGENDGRHFRAYAELYTANNLCFDAVTIDFDRSVNQVHQTRASVKKLSHDCEYIIYYFVYFYHLDSVSFDDAFVYLDKYGTHYSYENGLLSNTNNDEGTNTSYKDDDNDNVIETITQTISGVDSITDITYDENYNISEINNGDTTIKYEYNPEEQTKNQTTTQTNELGEIISFTETTEYIQNGNYISSFTDANGGVTRYTYDNGNNPIKGLVMSVTDPNGNTTNYAYDPNTDELLSVSGNATPSTPTVVSFTNENHLPKTVTRNGTTYSYAYDAQNRLTTSGIGSQALTTISYDSSQRIAKQTYGNGDEYVPVYDERNRMSGEKWNNTQISQYYYNKNDRLSIMEDNITGTRYQYDYAFYGMPFRISGSDGSLSTYDYDRTGRISRLTFSKNNENIYSAKYISNSKGLPSDVIIETLGGGTLLHYNYDLMERVVDQSSGSIISNISYVSNSADLISNFTNMNSNGNLINDYSYNYNQSGNITGVSDSASQTTVAYSYDGLDRLIEETIGNDTYIYSYDVGGNITSIAKNGVTISSYSYENNNWKDQLTAFDGKAITYDANGNPLTFDGYNYTWQRGTQLASITGNGKNISYVYDSQGHRVQKTVNGVTTNYLYSGDLLMRQTDETNTLDFAYDASNKVIGFNYNGVPYFYAFNQQGDVVAIADKEGTVVASYTYDAYGNILTSNGTMASINPIRYRGYYYDAETNWYYLETRYYNPEWRRFISADSAFIAGLDVINSSNMYAYSNDNPIMFMDSQGTSANSFRYNLIKSISEKTPNIFKKMADLNNSVLNKASQLSSSFAGKAAINILHLDDITDGFEVAESVVDDIVDFAIIDTEWEVKADSYENYETEKKFRLKNLAPKYLMVLGAGIGAWALDFHMNTNIFDPNFGNFTTLPGSYQWQSRVGYNWYYDLAFSLGGPTKVMRYPFMVEENGETTYYIVWCWKADYWNLGAGAEIGIYYTKDFDKLQKGYFEIGATDEFKLNVITEMDVTYDGTPITENFVQENWWVTSFSPRIQSPDIDKLVVNLKVKFSKTNTCGDLMPAFYTQLNDPNTQTPIREGLTWAPTANKARITGHNNCLCGKHPVECICNLNCTSSNCDKPCRYYSDFGDTNRTDIIGNNGFEFYIDF